MPQKEKHRIGQISFNEARCSLILVYQNSDAVFILY